MTLRLAILFLTVLALGCGGGGGPTTPSPPPGGEGGGGGGGGGGTNTTTFTISGNSVSPRSITVAPGTRVTFINNDSRPHEMYSDPHPEHGDCPAIDQVGFITPGQTKQTGNLNDVRTCGFHDHNQPEVAGLTGTIIVRNP
jgi:plastocyanin